jgi:hypothetical protein
VAKKKTTGIDKARQAISRTLKGAVKEQKKNTNALQRLVKQAQKQAQRNRDREDVAKWKALKRLGIYGNDKTSANIKNLTAARRRAIRRSFNLTQQHATFANGQTERPLQRTVKTTTTTWRKRGGGTYKTVKQSIRYDLAPHFKRIRTKRKVKEGTRGVFRTKKGYIVEVESPLSKVRVSKKGEIKEKTQFSSAGIEVTRYGVSGLEILKMIEQIDAGKFKIPRGTTLKVDNFGTMWGKEYDWETLDLLAQRVHYYENHMALNVFQHWLDSTEIRISRVKPEHM